MLTIAAGVFLGLLAFYLVVHRRDLLARGAKIGVLIVAGLVALAAYTWLGAYLVRELDAPVIAVLGVPLGLLWGMAREVARRRRTAARR